MKVKAALLAFIGIGLIFIMYQVFMKEKRTLISQAEAEAIATELYGGKVLNTRTDEMIGRYQISIENERGIYQLSVDGKTKAVSDLTLIERKQIPPDVKEPTNNKGKNNKGNLPPITEQKAKQIALQQKNGRVTNLSLVTTQKGKHYKVTVVGGTEGAHVYIQTNTGNVSSISWYSIDVNSDDTDDDDDNFNDDQDD